MYALLPRELENRTIQKNSAVLNHFQKWCSLELDHLCSKQNNLAGIDIFKAIIGKARLAGPF